MEAKKERVNNINKILKLHELKPGIEEVEEYFKEYVYLDECNFIKYKDKILIKNDLSVLFYEPVFFEKENKIIIIYGDFYQHLFVSTNKNDFIKNCFDKTVFGMTLYFERNEINPRVIVNLDNFIAAIKKKGYKKNNQIK